MRGKLPPVQSGDLPLVLATWALVAVTLYLAWSQSRLTRTDLRARLQLTFIDRFDGPRLLGARKILASRLLANAARDQIDETVMDFFEDMGLFLGQGYLDRKLLRSTFGFFAIRWWVASKGYVLEERKLQNEPGLFDGFERLAGEFSQDDARDGLQEPTPTELKRFLEDERDL